MKTITVLAVALLALAGCASQEPEQSAPLALQRVPVITPDPTWDGQSGYHFSAPNNPPAADPTPSAASTPASTVCCGAADPQPAAAPTPPPDPAPSTPKQQNDTGVELEQSGRPDAAASWYQQAAEQGYPPAQCNLGVLYFRGYGVAKNDQLAADLISKSAQQGEPKCMYTLGFIYAHTTGGTRTQNAVTARRWFDAVVASADPYYAGLAQQEIDALPGAADAPATAITAHFEDGGYFINGTVGGIATNFMVDTGSTRTMVDILTLERAGLQPVGIGSAVLANGSEDKTLVYIVPRLCVGTICASNMRVVAGVQGLLGPDFLRAAHAKATIAGNTLTLAPA
jgi:predicted aspartyl protease